MILGVVAVVRNNSHLTAIHRKSVSAPLQYLLKKDLVKGVVLDFGCGRGFDAEYLRCDRYDPYFFPQYPIGVYDTILCIYVLNVLEEHKHSGVYNQIRSLLKPSGNSYIAVRRDIIKEGYTGRGTYQTIVLPCENSQVLVDNSKFCIYSIIP